jgi:hypothetical protein
MGQYWYPVNLSKREFVHPHRLGCGLKLWEQVNGGDGGTGSALIVLCAAMPEPRGGGDLDRESKDAREVIGRWAGDRIALVGDYAKAADLPAEDRAETIVRRCLSKGDDGLCGELAKLGAYRDITDMVCRVLARACDLKYQGDGWRKRVPNQAESPVRAGKMKPDCVIG